MMDKEVLHAILFIFVITSIVFYFVYCVRDFKKTLHLRDKEHKEFLKSLKYGSVFVERLIPERDNPFLPSQPKHVRVIEIRINRYGETWVKYQIEDGDQIWYSPAQNFEKMYVKK